MLVLAEGLQDVRLTGVVSVGVLQTLEETLLQDEDGHSELVPQQLHRPAPRDMTTPAFNDSSSVLGINNLHSDCSSLSSRSNSRETFTLELAALRASK